MAKELQHILYIDDDQDILDVVKMSLERIGGFRVTTSHCSAGAVDLARQIMPDILMLDVMMPQTDGPTLLIKFREVKELKSVPIIFMTAKTQPAERDNYARMGVAGVISKPFNPLTLAAEVRLLWQSAGESSDVDFISDLRLNYLRMLATRRQEVEMFVGQHKTGTCSFAEYQNMARLAHNLVGSAQTYGFAAITAAARTLEEALSGRFAASAVTTAAQGLLQTILEALGQTDRAA